MLSRSCIRSSWETRLKFCGPLARAVYPHNGQTLRHSQTSLSFSTTTNGPFTTPTHIEPKLDFFGTFKDSFATITTDHSYESLVNTGIGKLVEVHGFLGKRKDLSEHLSFVNLYKNGESIQIVSREGPVHNLLKTIRPHSAVLITALTGQKHQRQSKTQIHAKNPVEPENFELELLLKSVKCLAAFPEDIIVGRDTQFKPEDRHLQIRFDQNLASRLKFRSKVLQACRQCLQDFQEVETPILFKSTPEGAREFLVPTRRPGYAYALPQSPQQYKQILMASGVHRYFQVAKCFRDEDLRADRQPEFTQLDIEMAFASGEVVMKRMELFIEGLFVNLRKSAGLTTPVPKMPFQRMTYKEAMESHGIDKPDLRIKALIQDFTKLISPQLAGMLTSIKKPIVEGFKMNVNGTPKDAQMFVKNFMDSAEAIPFQQNPDGAPGVFIYNPRRPLEGLQAFGHEGVKSLKALYNELDFVGATHLEAGATKTEPLLDNVDPEPFAEGDIIIIQARKTEALSGGSTALGRLRLAMHKAAIAKGLQKEDSSQHWLWVTDFPLFTPNNDTDPGQGGTAGFSATHHPFTSPKTVDDVDLLRTAPLEVKADHYDIVMNGVELGGGSRRVHNTDMQQYIMRDILKMSEERLKDFSHLFEVLRAGCPPHAGIALGLDRLVAVLLDRDSVRDVIAFPKSGKGEDLLVNSPSLMTPAQQATYHLKTVG